MTLQNTAVGEVSEPRIEMIGFLDKLGVVFDVLLPTVAKGILQRRESMMALGERFDVDKRAIRRLQKIREKYGNGPLLLRVLGRKHVLVLDKNDLPRVLVNAPEAFTPATDEKKKALGHFEPHVSLISRGTERIQRRQFNDGVLESRCPNHSFGDRFVTVASEEIATLLRYCGPKLTWTKFSPVWDRIVRRVVLGDSARDDSHLSDLLTDLRHDGNWAALRPRNKKKLEEFKALLEQHLARAEPGSLAAAVARAPKSATTAPCSQVTHWIFAFDAGAIAAFNALAVLASNSELRARAVSEATSGRGTTDECERTAFPYLRSCVLESLRLWPTTMIVHRKTTQETQWDKGTIPAGLSVLLFAPYFHRDDRDNPNANRFSPDIWVADPNGTKLPFMPFSAGGGACPGRHVTLLTAAACLAALLQERDIRLVGSNPFSATNDLPGTVNHFAIELDISSPASISAANVLPNSA